MWTAVLKTCKRKLQTWKVSGALYGIKQSVILVHDSSVGVLHYLRLEGRNVSMGSLVHRVYSCPVDSMLIDANWNVNYVLNMMTLRYAAEKGVESWRSSLQAPCAHISHQIILFSVHINSLIVSLCPSLLTDDKVSDQYVVQRPSARASRRKDEFIWYDKTSGTSGLSWSGITASACCFSVICWSFRPPDTFVKPNLWLWVNPNIACPIQYREDATDAQAELAEEFQTPLLGPAGIKPPTAAQLHMFAANDDALQEEILPSASSSSGYLVSCMFPFILVGQLGVLFVSGFSRRPASIDGLMSCFGFTLGLDLAMEINFEAAWWIQWDPQPCVCWLESLQIIPRLFIT